MHLLHKIAVFVVKLYKHHVIREALVIYEKLLNFKCNY